MELGPAARLVGRGTVGPGHLQVLRDALHGTAGAQGEVAGQGDADGAVGIARDQRRVLETHGPARAVVARTVVEVGHFGSGLPVEDLDAEVGRHNDVLVPGAQVGGRHRSVDGAEHGRVPNGLAGGGVQRPHRPCGDRRRRAFDDSQLAVALNVGQGRAAARQSVQRVVPDLVAPAVEDLDRVLVAGAGEEAPRARRDAVGAAGQDGPDRGRRVHLLVGGGAADEAAVVVVDAEVAAVAVVVAVGETGRGRATGDEVVGTRAVEVTDGGGGEDAVGRELRPSRGGSAVRRVERIGLLPERTGFDQRAAVGDGGRGLDPHVVERVRRRVVHHLVPHLGPARRVGVVAPLFGLGGVARAEVEVAVVGIDRRRRVDGRAAGDLDALGGRARRRAPHAGDAPLGRAGGGRRGDAAPARQHGAVLQVEAVDVTLAVAELHAGRPIVVERDRRRLPDAARRVVQVLDPRLRQAQRGRGGDGRGADGRGGNRQRGQRDPRDARRPPW